MVKLEKIKEIQKDLPSGSIEMIAKLYKISIHTVRNVFYGKSKNKDTILAILDYAKKLKEAERQVAQSVFDWQILSKHLPPIDEKQATINVDLALRRYKDLKEYIETKHEDLSHDFCSEIMEMAYSTRRIDMDENMIQKIGDMIIDKNRVHLKGYDFFRRTQPQAWH